MKRMIFILLIFMFTNILGQVTSIPKKLPADRNGNSNTVLMYFDTGDSTFHHYSFKYYSMSFDSASTTSDTADFGGIREIVGILSDSDFDSSAVSVKVSIFGSAELFTYTSINIDSGIAYYFSSPVYARKVNFSFSAQNSSSGLHVIYR